jgi:hypothetical protein
MTEPTEHLHGGAAQPAMPWAATEPAAADRATPRARRFVENLPAWEPLPPGEILVQRRGHAPGGA